MTKEDLTLSSGDFQKEEVEAQERKEDESIYENPVLQKEKQERLRETDRHRETGTDTERQRGRKTDF